MSRFPRRAVLGALALMLVAGCGRNVNEESDATAPVTTQAGTESAPTETSAAGDSVAPSTTSATDTVATADTSDTSDTADTSATSDSAEPADTADPDETGAASTTVAANVPECTDDGSDAPETVPEIDKPEVELPDETPTGLVATDLEVGQGPCAESGDVVLVHYVGVRSKDGFEFDNSFDDGQPFSVTLGAGGVIPGWDQGLVGIQKGGLRQLDIPSELAYGEQGAGTDIAPGDALSFVVQAVDIFALPSPEDAPDVSGIEGQENVTELEIEDEIVGDGPEIELGQTALVHLIALRADTAEVLVSSWEGGAPDSITYDEASVVPGLFEGFAGMKVGGRRVITLPFEPTFGTTGNESLGLPPETDLIVIVDLIAAY